MVAAIGHWFWEQHFPLGLGQQSGQHYLKRPTSKVSEVSTWKGHMLKGTGMICSWHCAGSSRLFVGHVDLPVIYIYIHIPNIQCLDLHDAGIQNPPVAWNLPPYEDLSGHPNTSKWLNWWIGCFFIEGLPMAAILCKENLKHCIKIIKFYNSGMCVYCFTGKNWTSVWPQCVYRWWNFGSPQVDQVADGIGGQKKQSDNPIFENCWRFGREDFRKKKL